MDLIDLTESEIVNLAITAVPQFGGDDRKLRVIGWPAVAESADSDVSVQTYWYDRPNNPEVKMRRFSMQVQFGRSMTMRELGWTTCPGVSRATFNRVWELATARRAAP